MPENRICIRGQRIFEKCTAMQNAEALGVFYDDFQIERFCKQMQAFDVPVSKQYGAMSRGEKLKCQLAFAIAHQPVLYLIDEATAGMDAVFRLQFLIVCAGWWRTKAAAYC